MDYEDFLAEIFTPLKGIEVLSNIIYEKCNNDWDFLSNNTKRNDFDELIALNFLIHLSVKYLLKIRKSGILNIKNN